MEVVRRSRARERIAEIKARHGGNPLIFSNHILANDLLANGLADELHLLVGNVVAGESVRTFEPSLNAPVKLLDQRHIEGSDIAALHYDLRPH